jgi:predicted outer membrane repeat protein
MRKSRSARSGRFASALAENLETRQLLSNSIVVNSTADSGPGTLRQAVATAESATTSTSITFDSSVFPLGAQTRIDLQSTLVISNTASNPINISAFTCNVTIDSSGSGFNLVDVAPSSVVEMNYLIFANASVQNPGLNGAAIQNDGTLMLDDDALSNNLDADGDGGAVYNAGALTVVDTTFTNNTARGGTGAGVGGALYNAESGTTSVVNCTLANNQAVQGGAIGTAGPLTLDYDTIANNTATAAGAGIYSASSTVTMDNTLAAQNDQSGTTTELDYNGTPMHEGSYDLLGVIGDAGPMTNSVSGTAAAPLNPLIGTLGYYGGMAQTLPLLPGSPAIQSGQPNSASLDYLNDERGEPRNYVLTDIGAFASQGFKVVAGGTSSQSTAISQPFANPLVVAVEPVNYIEPVAGGIVDFSVTTASSGATAALSASKVTITSAGTAAVTATANGTGGYYTASAMLSPALSDTGLAVQVSFSLNNATNNLVVNTTGDPATTTPGITSLRQAIAAAAAALSNPPDPHPQPAYITFSPTVFPTGSLTTITLKQGPITWTAESVEFFIDASGQVAISGGGSQSVFAVSADQSAYLQGLTITQGDAPGSSSEGGAILNQGTLGLDDCTLTGNQAGFNGGAISCQGQSTLVADDDTFTGNSAANGGALFVGTGSTADVTSSTFTGNAASDEGGAVLAGQNCTFTATNDTIARNSGGDGGGIYNAGQGVTLQGSIIAAHQHSQGRRRLGRIAIPQLCVWIRPDRRGGLQPVG